MCNDGKRYGYSSPAKWRLESGPELAGGVQDESDRQLPAADDDAGGDQVAVLQHRRSRELQANTRQAHW